MTQQWRCVHCGHVRVPGEPPITPLLEPYGHARCQVEGINRTFRLERPAGERDLAEGIRRKEEGQARASNGYSQLDNWPHRFDTTVEMLAQRRVPFTSEDATAITGLPPAGSPSAVGARMTAAAKRGIIRKTGRYVKAERPNQHAAVIAEWIGA
jgi:hypothetical protein